MCDGQRYELFEYTSGYVECAPVLAALLGRADLSLPTGEALDDACLILFGDTLQVYDEPQASDNCVHVARRKA